MIFHPFLRRVKIVKQNKQKRILINNVVLGVRGGEGREGERKKEKERKGKERKEKRKEKKRKEKKRKEKKRKEKKRKEKKRKEKKRKEKKKKKKRKEKKKKKKKEKKILWQIQNVVCVFVCLFIPQYKIFVVEKLQQVTQTTQ